LQTSFVSPRDADRLPIHDVDADHAQVADERRHDPRLFGHHRRRTEPDIVESFRDTSATPLYARWPSSAQS
jgi:hypothetical protein